MTDPNKPADLEAAEEGRNIIVQGLSVFFVGLYSLAVVDYAATETVEAVRWVVDLAT